MKSKHLFAFGLVLWIVRIPVAEAQTVHELKANPDNVHWEYFSAAVKPAVTVNSGDVVIIEDVPWVDPENVERSGVPRGEIPENHRAIYREVKDRGPGPHVLVGPVYVNGAEPGDTLEVRILEVELAYSYAYNRQRATAGTLPEDFTQFWERIIRVDRQKKTAEVARGVAIPLTQPFFGAMGVAPHASASTQTTFLRILVALCAVRLGVRLVSANEGDFRLIQKYMKFDSYLGDLTG